MSPRNLFALAAVLVIGACKGSAPAVDGPLPGAYVLVRRDAVLRTTAASSPATVTVGEADDEPMAFRVLSQRGEWLTVEPVMDTCVRKLRGIEHLHLTLQVRVDALTPVLTRRVSARFDDGTRIDLEPGVPIGTETGDGRFRVCDVQCGELAIPADAIGLGYRSGGPYFASRSTKQYVTNGTIGEIGGHLAQLTDPTGWTQLETSRVEARGDQHLVSVAGRCSQWSALVPRDAVIDSDYVGSFKLMRPLSGNRVPEGTPLTWPDGSAAGDVGESGVELGEEISHEGDRACFDRPIGSDVPIDEATIRLCVPWASVEP